MRRASPNPAPVDKPGMDAPPLSDDTPLRPRAAALRDRLRELDGANDAFELRLAVVRQQLKAAEARATSDPADALDRIEQARQRLRRAG